MKKRTNVPYPNPDVDDLGFLLLKEIMNGTFIKSIKNAISNNNQPLNRYINVEDSIVDRLAKGKMTTYDISDENTVYDLAKIREWGYLPHYIETVDGADIIYNARKFYTKFDWIASGLGSYIGKDIECVGSQYTSKDNNGMLILSRPNNHKDGDNFIYSFFSLEHSGKIIPLSYTSPYSSPYQTCDNFVFRVLPNRSIETFTIEYGFTTFTVPDMVSTQGYGDHIFVLLSNGDVGVYGIDGIPIQTLKNVSATPYCKWGNKYIFKYKDDKETGTLIYNYKKDKILKKKNSLWYQKGVMGLYDFYGGGTYKGTRWKYSLRKYGNFTADTPFKDPILAFDRFGDFQYIIAGDKKGYIMHTYDNIHFTLTGGKFILPCKARRYIFGNGGGYFGNICLSNQNGNYYIKTELFKLSK